MTRQYTRLADIQYIADSAGAIYTNPASAKTYIKSFVLFNGNSSAETVKLYNVPDNAGAVGTAGVSNQFVEITLSALETLMFDLPYPITLIDENDTIQAVTITASKVTVQILGDTDA
jgi:hypothetical protein